MNLGEKLAQLRDVAPFPELGGVNIRWGQLLREEPSLASLLQSHRQAASITSLGDLASIKSGVVTRANAFFILKELEFDQIPKRFHLTRRDFLNSAVVLDGVNAPFRIERRWLKRLLRGPEDLVNAFDVARTEYRLFDVTVSKEQLRAHTVTGALAYLRRGETFAYRTSEDDLKGGIPAERAQVKVRKPFWYSLHVPAQVGSRIVVPEHYNKRYIATLLPSNDDSVVNDTLYTIQLEDQRYTEVVHAALNSLLTWYQLELRGRTQHGEGVLKVKIPDFRGILIANPSTISARQKRELLARFAAIPTSSSMDVLESVSDRERTEFDETYLRVCGFANPSEIRLVLERELRAAIAERHERKASVAEAKLDRRRVRANANVDAYATRIAAFLGTFPDPRTLTPNGVPMEKVSIQSKVDAPIHVGADLFNQSEVFSGSTCIAVAKDNLSAHFVRLALLHDPELTVIDVPSAGFLQPIMKQFEEEAIKWRLGFDAACFQVLEAVTDERLRRSITERALVLLHAK
jgi:hypothetical protein